MKACNACTIAAQRYTGYYENWCDGCMARAVSRTLAAFHALDPHGTGDKEALRETIASVFPEAKRDKGRQDVWAWWQLDHNAASTTKVPVVED